MEIHEKIAQLRAFLKLTREQFADAAGISRHTVVSIEVKKTTPRSDTLQSIAETWPRFSIWLLEGSEKISLIGAGTSYRIIDVVDCRYMSELVINPSHISNVTLVQSSDSSNRLGALLTLEKDIYLSADKARNQYQCQHLKSAVWVKTGNMSLVSTGGGKLAINSFRSWLIDCNEMLLEHSKLLCATDEEIRSIHQTLSFRSEWLKKCESSEIAEYFNSWKGKAEGWQ